MRPTLIGLLSAPALLAGGLLFLAGTGSAHAQAKPAATATAKAGPKLSAKPAKKGCGAPRPKLAEAAKKTEAKKAYEAGKKHFEKSDHEAALSCFQLADSYVPGGRPKYFIAQSYDKLGKAQEAVAAYDAFLKEVAPGGAVVADKYKDDAATAKTRIEALKQTPGKINVRVNPAAAPNLRFALDGGPQGSPEMSAPPGKHTVTVTADGYDRAVITVELGFGETREAPITLTKTGSSSGAPEPATTGGPAAGGTAQASTTGSIPGAPPPAEPTKPSNNLMTAGYVTLGVGCAAAIGLGVFGGLALTSKGEFQARPTTAKADETDRNALIADVFLGPTVAIGGTAIVLLILGATRSPPAKTGATSPAKAATLSKGFVVPYATPSSAGASALFTF